MSKGLEALEELKFQVGNITYHTHDLQITTFKVRDSGLFEIIEKELKEYEELKKPKQIVGTTTIDKTLEKFLIDNNPSIAKKLKALEIVKECLIVDDKGDYIEIACDFSIPKKIKEKYDLLKEVLL